MTHFPEFGRLKFVHASIDPFSGTQFASAHTGETAEEACHHFTSAFATLGIPQQIKTDNGPAYISHKVANFSSLWGITHKTGISHSLTRQSIIERAHGSLKHLLAQEKAGNRGTPAERLQKALYVFNFLNCSMMDLNPSTTRHFASSTSLSCKEKPPVLIYELESVKILGPYPLVTWKVGLLVFPQKRDLVGSPREM